MKRFLIMLLCLFLASIPILQEGILYSEKLIFLNLILATISVVSLFVLRKEPYSLYKIFHVFVLFFFCIAPSIQYTNGVRFWGTFFSESDYLLTTSCVVFIVILFNVCFRWFYKKIHISNKKNNRPIQLTFGKECLLVTVSVCICFYFLYINNFNLISLLFRLGQDRMAVSQITFLLTEYFFRPMPMFIFLSAYMLKVKHKIVLPLLFVLMLITAPPTGMARFSAAALYIPVLICLIPSLQKGYRFLLLMFVGILVLFPMLELFRVFSSDMEFTYTLNFNQFKDLHFDSYSMFMRVLRDNVVTYGYQLLGVLFFFVPRSIWTTKPVGSGCMVAEANGMSMTNVSMPFFGEGYVNFGLFGILLFVVIMAFFTARIDKWYWRKEVYSSCSLNKILYFNLLGLLFFMLRGDLLSSYAYMCGFTCSFFFVKKLCTN